MGRSGLGVFLLMLLPAVAHAQVSINNLGQMMNGIVPGSVTKTQCDNALGDLRTAPSPQLFYDSKLCAVAGQDMESTVLLLAGQLRATVDLTLFEPADDASKQNAARLYGTIFFALGGAGSDSQYRDPVRRDTILEKLDSWSPELPATYDPGWKYKSFPISNAYLAAIAEMKAHRREQLAQYSKLISNPDYFDASNELDRIQERNPRGVDTNGPDGRRADELQAIMAEIENRISPPLTGKSRPN